MAVVFARLHEMKSSYMKIDIASLSIRAHCVGERTNHKYTTAASCRFLPFEAGLCGIFDGRNSHDVCHIRRAINWTGSNHCTALAWRIELYVTFAVILQFVNGQVIGRCVNVSITAVSSFNDVFTVFVPLAAMPLGPATLAKELLRTSASWRI